MGNVGSIKESLRGGYNNALNQLKSYNVKDKVTSGLNSVGIETDKLKMPDLKVPEELKNPTSKLNTSIIKVPDANQYLDQIKTKGEGLLGSISSALPSEIGGVQLPKLPDLSSLTSKINSTLEGSGINLKDNISFDDIKNFITKGDINSIVDMNGIMPSINMDAYTDPSKVMADVDMNSVYNLDGAEGIDEDYMAQVQAQVNAMKAEQAAAGFPTY